MPISASCFQIMEHPCLHPLKNMFVCLVARLVRLSEDVLLMMLDGGYQSLNNIL
jgi:hypothetical protein